MLWTGCLGLAFAGWLALLRAAFERGSPTERSTGRRRALWLLRCTAAALPVLAFVCWVPSSWVSEHWEELARTGRVLVIVTYVVLFLGTLGASLVASWLARQQALTAPPRFHRWLAPA